MTAPGGLFTLRGRHTSPAWERVRIVFETQDSDTSIFSDAKPRLGISACLLGEPVRFDGGHKRDRFLTDTLGRYVEWVPMCPEVECGMPIPRPAIRLVGSDPGQPSVLERRSGVDHTTQLRDWAEARARRVAALQLDGFVLKKNSPSCGLERVRRYDAADSDDAPARDGRGVFTLALLEHAKRIPLTEEGRLSDGCLREDFLSGIFTHHRLRVALRNPSHETLLSSHAAHKLLYMAHSPQGPAKLGQRLAGGRGISIAEMTDEYMRGAMGVMATPTSRGKHANVLQHVLGFFKKTISPAEKQEMLTVIDDFARGTQPLAVPLALFRHYLNRHDVSDWLRAQVYFEPFPHEIAQRAARSG